MWSKCLPLLCEYDCVIKKSPRFAGTFSSLASLHKCELHVLKVTKFVFDFKLKSKFNSHKALSAVRKSFSLWHSHSIFCIHFCNFLINYMTKIIYLLPSNSKRWKNRRLYLSKRFFFSMFISYHIFWLKMEFLIYNSVFWN